MAPGKAEAKEEEGNGRALEAGELEHGFLSSVRGRRHRGLPGGHHKHAQITKVLGPGVAPAGRNAASARSTGACVWERTRVLSQLRKSSHIVCTASGNGRSRRADGFVHDLIARASLGATNPEATGAWRRRQTLVHSGHEGQILQTCTSARRMSCEQLDQESGTRLERVHWLQTTVTYNDVVLIQAFANRLLVVGGGRDSQL